MFVASFFIKQIIKKMNCAPNGDDDVIRDEMIVGDDESDTMEEEDQSSRSKKQKVNSFVFKKHRHTFLLVHSFL